MINTKQEALNELKYIIQTQTIQLGWDQKPISFEELINDRLGNEILIEIYEVIDK